VDDSLADDPRSPVVKLLLTFSDAAIVSIDSHHKSRLGAGRSGTVCCDGLAVPIENRLRS
jgi:hypothetical protein